MEAGFGAAFFAAGLGAAFAGLAGLTAAGLRFFEAGVVKDLDALPFLPVNPMSRPMLKVSTNAERRLRENGDSAPPPPHGRGPPMGVIGGIRLGYGRVISGGGGVGVLYLYGFSSVFVVVLLYGSSYGVVLIYGTG